MTVRRPPPDQRRLREPADLTAVWTSVLDGEPFRQRVVWMLFIDLTQRPVGPLITLDDLPDGPYDVKLDDLVGLCREFIDGPGAATSVAFLMARPGGVPWTVSDRAWGRFLVAGVEAVGAEPWPVHWAHRGGVEEFRLAPSSTNGGRPDSAHGN